MRMDLGAEGYGIYFMLIEKLAAEKTHVLKLNTKMLAWDLRVPQSKIEKVINNYGLFLINSDENSFKSSSLLERMEKTDAVSKVRSEAGRAGAAARIEKAKLLKTNQEEHEDENICLTNAEQNSSKCLAKIEQNKILLEQNFSKIKEKVIEESDIKEDYPKEKINKKEKKIKSSSSKPSSAEAVEDTDEAAEAAEEEDLEFENDLFELWEKAIKAMTRVKMPAASCHEEWETVCRMLSTPNEEDRETLISMLNEMTRNGKNGAEMVSMLRMADKKRPINEIDKRTWNAINAVCGLSSTDARQIKAAVGRDKGRWRDLAIAVEEVKRSKKIVQPARYILSKLK